MSPDKQRFVQYYTYCTFLAVCGSAFSDSHYFSLSPKTSFNPPIRFRNNIHHNVK